MRLTPKRRSLCLVAAAALLAADPAAADPPAAYGARRAAEIRFRDWRLGCLGPDCAVATAVRGADGASVLGVAADSRALTFSTGLPLFLPDGIVLTIGEEPPRHVAWRTCDKAGCVAEAPLDPSLLDALRRERAAEATLTLVDGVRIRLPLSLLGFTAAWEAREARDPTPPAPIAPEPRPASAPDAPDAAPGAASTSQADPWALPEPEPAPGAGGASVNPP